MSKQGQILFNPTKISRKAILIMSSKKVLKLRQSILKYNTEMTNLKSQLETSEEANIKYNKLVIKKAICKKELDEARTSLIQKFFKKFSHNPNKDNRLICDYFKS